MIPLLGLVIAGFAYAWWAGKLSTRQIPAAILMVVGAGVALKGQFLGGIGVFVVGLAWFAGARNRRIVSQTQSDQYAIDQARHLLGATVDDDADKIRARHRRLITENHPDTGGSEERAALLNEARDLLLAELRNQKADP